MSIIEKVDGPHLAYTIPVEVKKKTPDSFY